MTVKFVVTGESGKTQIFPVRRQCSLSRQYAPWLRQPVWQITRSAAAMLASSNASLPGTGLACGLVGRSGACASSVWRGCAPRHCQCKRSRISAWMRPAKNSTWRTNAGRHGTRHIAFQQRMVFAGESQSRHLHDRRRAQAHHLCLQMLYFSPLLRNQAATTRLHRRVFATQDTVLGRQGISKRARWEHRLGHPG